MQHPEPTQILLSLLAHWPRHRVSDVLFSFDDPLRSLITGEVRAVLRRHHQQRERVLPETTPDVPTICYFENAYPERLRQIPDPPLVLFYQGNLDALNARPIAIVGARKATRRGIDFAHYLASGLSRAGLVVVSGLAHGIDGAAHQGALAAKARTVAVMGSGLERVYPQHHHNLAREIVRLDGLLLSEYAPPTPPLAHQFPERNRIISGLSEGVVVVEAGMRSGSLITARLALEQGRDVFAVPGPVSSFVSQGCHNLIRQGAELVGKVDEVLASLGVVLEDSVAQPVERLDPDQRYLLQFIQGYSATMDELVGLSGWSVAKLAAVLSEMELAGIVALDADGYIATPQIIE